MVWTLYRLACIFLKNSYMFRFAHLTLQSIGNVHGLPRIYIPLWRMDILFQSQGILFPNALSSKKHKVMCLCLCKSYNLQGKVFIQAKWPVWPVLIADFLQYQVSGSTVCLLPLDEMLLHRRVIPKTGIASTHLYSWVERGTVRLKCLAQEHSTMSLAKARTRTTRSRAGLKVYFWLWEHLCDQV